MERFIFVFLLAIATLCNSAAAQTVAIKGSVIDYESAEPLPFHNVSILECCLTTTDANGNFNLLVPKSALSDTLKLGACFYNPLFVTGLPAHLDTIWLHKLPCLRNYNLKQYKHMWKYSKASKEELREFKKKRREFLNQKEELLQNYVYIYNKEEKKIVPDTFLINLCNYK